MSQSKANPSNIYSVWQKRIVSGLKSLIDALNFKVGDVRLTK